jgi:hypothetical protein
MGQRWVTDNLAWRKNLSKTRAVMKISAPSRIPGLGQGANRRLRRRAAGRLRGCARPRLFSAVIALGGCLALGCGDDDPAAQTGVGGSSGSPPPDASVLALPGDGREPTPDFDTESRQRTPIGPQRLVESVDEIRDDIERAMGGGSEAPDAAPSTPADPADGGAN